MSKTKNENDNLESEHFSLFVFRQGGSGDLYYFLRPYFDWIKMISY
jgi:hypothetical protein